MDREKLTKALTATLHATDSNPLRISLDEDCPICRERVLVLMEVFDEHLVTWLRSQHWESASIIARWWEESKSGS